MDVAQAPQKIQIMNGYGSKTVETSMLVQVDPQQRFTSLLGVILYSRACASVSFHSNNLGHGEALSQEYCECTRNHQKSMIRIAISCS